MCVRLRGCVLTSMRTLVVRHVVAVTDSCGCDMQESCSLYKDALEVVEEDGRESLAHDTYRQAIGAWLGCN